MENTYPAATKWAGCGGIWNHMKEFLECIDCMVSAIASNHVNSYCNYP